jgi:hypothetical protein
MLPAAALQHSGFVAALLLATNLSVPIERAISVSERDALVKIFQSTGGPAWKQNDGWLSTADPCDWFGVMCDWDSSGSHLTVAGLSLPFNNLKGALPADASRLSGLRTLDLNGNELSGTLPEEWLTRWDRNDFELFVTGNHFANFVSRVRITFSASALLCAVDEDVRYSVELADAGAAHFESTRCAGPNTRKTYCLVKDGTAPSLARFTRALKRLNFDQISGEYSFPFTFSTHQAYVTTTVWFGDGTSRTFQIYGDQAPIEAHIVQDMVWGLVEQAEWQRRSRKNSCARTE